jgi:CBS-domain-containing membrane protein
MQVKDLMTKEVILVNINTKIREISQILTRHAIHGVPVIDDNDLIAGIITESDFFIKDIPDLYLPSYIEFMKKAELAATIDKEEKEKIEKLMNATANDIMTTDPITVRPDDRSDEVIRLFKDNHLFTIPVIDESRKVVGIITVADIIRLFK